MDSAFMTDIDRVSDLSKQEHYDSIIVGSGLAGGVLAKRLIEKETRVILIETGGLAFSAHCLNTSRPHWQVNSLEGPPQDNDVVYGAMKKKVQTAAGSDTYAGGPVYCLGGRSNVWGLYSPRIVEKLHRACFPQNISDYLETECCKRAFSLFTNESQDAITSIPRITKTWMKPLNSSPPTGDTTKSVPTVHLSPMGAEFKSTKLYNFPQGTYSTVDFLLDCTYARDAKLTISLNTEVLTVPTDTDAKLHSVMARCSASGSIHPLFAKKVILCAGTIATATIAFNSGLQKTLPPVGKGLTDHKIWGVRFLKAKTAKDIFKDPIKFQCTMVIGGHDALLNVAIIANTFPARPFRGTQCLEDDGKPSDPTDPSPDKQYTINVTIGALAELADRNEVLNIPTLEPVVYIKHVVKDEENYENKQKEMQDLATRIRNKVLKINPSEPAPRLSQAGFGAVAHKVGTMRTKGPKSTKNYVVNEDFQVQGHKDLYVCDLSIFPLSPPANPSLTLAAIAFWLADSFLSAGGRGNAHWVQERRDWRFHNHRVPVPRPSVQQARMVRLFGT